MLILIHLLQAEISSSNPLRDIMDANHLTRLNFIDWFRNVKILLRSECIAYVLEGDGLIEPALNVFEDEICEY